MKNENYKIAKVLLVDDCEDDVELVKMAIEKAKLLLELDVASTGEEAIDYLLSRKPSASNDLPDLLLLDINMPGMNGLEVLHRIKTDSDLKRIPVVILTTSIYENDVLNSYSEHANSYIEKPLDFHSFTKMIEQLSNFWFSLVTLPSTITRQ